MASSQCVEGGVAMWMICTSSRAASAWMSAQDRQAKFLARLARSLRDRAKFAQAEAAKRAAPEQSHAELRAR
jgi:hypothetical protein